jgi:hypothetical protein
LISIEDSSDIPLNILNIAGMAIEGSSVSKFVYKILRILIEKEIQVLVNNFDSAKGTLTKVK